MHPLRSSSPALTIGAGRRGARWRLTLEAGASRTLTAQALETGAGVEGALGDGHGKWRLSVTADRPVHAMNLLASPTGHLTNLSTIPGRTAGGSATGLAVLQPTQGTVYQGQNDVPLVLEFTAGLSLLEIAGESGQLVYRAEGPIESPLSSSIRSARLDHGPNVLTLTARFEDGASVSKSVTVTMQKEPDPASSLESSALYRLEPSGLAQVADDLHLEQTERVRFMAANTYSDGFVQICTDRLAVGHLQPGGPDRRRQRDHRRPPRNEPAHPDVWAIHAPGHGEREPAHADGDPDRAESPAPPGRGRRNGDRRDGVLLVRRNAALTVGGTFGCGRRRC